MKAGKVDKLWEETGGHCVYCNCPKDGCHRTADHVWPKSKGGSNCFNNLVPACKHCNTARGNRVPSSAFACELHKGYVRQKEIDMGIPTDFLMSKLTPKKETPHQ